MLLLELAAALAVAFILSALFAMATWKRGRRKGTRLIDGVPYESRSFFFS
jgi:hypothetical protein